MLEPKPEQPIQQAQQAVEQATAARPVRRTRAILFQIYLVIAVIIVGFLAFLANTREYLNTDVAITQLMQQIHSPAAGTLMTLISWPGFDPQSTVLVLLSVFSLAILGLHWEAVMIGGTALLSQVVNASIKLAIQRPRPSGDLVEFFGHMRMYDIGLLARIDSYGFPSGHVMFYTAFFGFIFFLVYTLLKPSWWRSLLLVLLGSLIVLIGPSRIYLGEHWASDVLAAYLASSLILILSISVYRWGKPRFFRRQPVAPAQTDD